MKKVSKKLTAERPVLVTTERGVFFGYATDTSGKDVFLRNARCAIYWATKTGFMELATLGPNHKSRIGARADVEIRNVTSVVEVQPAAVVAWEK